jgi:hypothetical protein
MKKVHKKSVGVVRGTDAKNSNNKSNTLYTYCDCGKRSYIELDKLAKDNSDLLVSGLTNIISLSVECPNCKTVSREENVIL